MEKFKQAILNFNRQLTPTALTCSNLSRLKSVQPDAIVIVGMGGSGQIGDLIANLAQELKISVPVVVWKDYDLPKINFKKPLYIFISFSGNTEEILSGFSTKGGSASGGKPLLKTVVSSGGKLQLLAKKNNIPLVSFSKNGLVPRQTAGYMFYGAMQIIKAAFKNVSSPAFAKIQPKKLEAAGKNTSRLLKGKTILIYGTSQNSHLTYNWKTRLNETAKSLAFTGILPEISHNEIVPFDTRPKNLIVVFLEDSQDHPRNKKKIGLIIKLLKSRKVPILKVKLVGKSRLEKTWNSLLLADWISYYLAKSKGIKPETTKLIDQLKSQM